MGHLGEIHVEAVEILDDVHGIFMRGAEFELVEDLIIVIHRIDAFDVDDDIGDADQNGDNA